MQWREKVKINFMRPRPCQLIKWVLLYLFLILSEWGLSCITRTNLTSVKLVNVCWLLNRGKDDTSFVSVSHRRLDVQPKHDSDPDKKHPDKNRKEKHTEEHRNKKRHEDDPDGDEKHPEEPQNEKHPQEIRKEKHLEEPKKQKHAEDAQLETDNKKQKHVQDLLSEKHKPEPRKERLFGEPKRMRHVEEVKKEKHPEEPKKHSYTDDMKKDRHREESRWLINSPPREKPADPHRPLFERWDWGGSETGYYTSETYSRASDWMIYFRRGVLDSSVLYPTRYPSPPRPARPPPPIKRPSVDLKKDRSGFLHRLSMKDWNVPADTAWHNHSWVICTDICSNSFITRLTA